MHNASALTRPHQHHVYPLLVPHLPLRRRRDKRLCVETHRSRSSDVRTRRATRKPRGEEEEVAPGANQYAHSALCDCLLLRAAMERPQRGYSRFLPIERLRALGGVRQSVEDKWNPELLRNS